MPIAYTNSIGAGYRFTLLANQALYVAGNSRVESTSSDAVISSAANVSVRVTSGSTVTGAVSAVYFSDTTKTGKSLQIDANAMLSAGSYAAYITGDDFSVTNAGQMASAGFGIIYEMNNLGHEGSIVNTGLIVAGSAIVNNTSFDQGFVTITNSGTILADSQAYRSASGTATDFQNTGEIVGSFAFGDLGDKLNTVQGTIDGSIDMGGGNDTLAPGMVAENANGGTGDDWLDFSTHGAVSVYLDGFSINTGAALGDVYGAFEHIIGSASGSDDLRGNFAKNRLEGLGGNDNLFGMADADTLLGGAGNDWLDGGTSIDRMEGGAGNDLFVTDSASDVIIELAGGGVDTVFALIASTLAAEVENGVVGSTVGGGLTGNILSNRLSGGLSGDTLIGLDGHDTLLGGSGGDNLDGGAGNDSLDGGTGADILRGGAGNDIFVVDDTGDAIIEAAAGGNDLVQTAINLTLATEVEKGQITGSAGRGLTGNGLGNTLSGATGHDNLKGLVGADVLSGGLGNDTLVGGKGADTLTGGLGADRFHFAARTEGLDRITDFATGDKISIAVAGFGGGLAAGSLATGAFVARGDNVAQDVNDRFIFRTTDHSLWFDQNGSTAGGLTSVAVLSGSYILGAGDFLLI